MSLSSVLIKMVQDIQGPCDPDSMIAILRKDAGKKNSETFGFQVLLLQLPCQWIWRGIGRVCWLLFAAVSDRLLHIQWNLALKTTSATGVKWSLLCRPFKEKAIRRDHFVCPSIRPSQKLNIGYIFAISQYFFIKRSNYIAYENMLVMMPDSLGEDHIWWSYVPFCTCIFILTWHQRATEVFNWTPI
jgi:hypothetical protein